MRRAGGSRTPSRDQSPQQQAKSEMMVSLTLPPPARANSFQDPHCVIPTVTEMQRLREVLSFARVTQQGSRAGVPAGPRSLQAPLQPSRGPCPLLAGSLMGEAAVIESNWGGTYSNRSGVAGAG